MTSMTLEVATAFFNTFGRPFRQAGNMAAIHVNFLLVLLGVFCQLIAAHGSLKAIEVAGKQYLAWQIHADDNVKPPPVRYARRVVAEGPVKDFTGKGITYDALSIKTSIFLTY